MFTTAPFVVSTSVLKVDPVLDFFLSASWCFWGVRSNKGGTLLSFARYRCSFRLTDVSPAVLVTNQKSCGTFASRKTSPNVSQPYGLKYFRLRSTSLTKYTTFLLLTVSPLYVSSPLSLQAMLGSAFIFRTNSSALVFIVFGTLCNISSSIASFVSVLISAGGDVDTLDTSALGQYSS